MDTAAILHGTSTGDKPQKLCGQIAWTTLTPEMPLRSTLLSYEVYQCLLLKKKSIDTIMI